MKLEAPTCERCLLRPADLRIMSVNQQPFLMAACMKCADEIGKGASYEAQSIFEDPGQPYNCDFCLLGRPAWEFPVPDFQIRFQTRIHQMTGNWLACEECKTMIEAKRHDDLVKRCSELFEKQHGYPFDAEAVRPLWDKVFELMEGEPWPVSFPSAR